MNEDPGPASLLLAAPGGVRSRRQLLSAAGLAGAAGLLAGCTTKVVPVSSFNLNPHAPGSKRDGQIMNGLLALEYRAIAAYSASIPLLPQPPTSKPGLNGAQPPHPKAGGPSPPLTLMVPLSSSAAQQFLGQELDHVNELTGFIDQIGVKPVGPRPSYDIGHSTSKQDLLRLLRGIEQDQLAAYLHAAKTLTPGRLRSAAAAIFANHAQHLMVLRYELGLHPIPSAFVTGGD